MRWAEAAGYEVDVIAQSDLHFRPDILSAYRCLVMVGHDEYWSWQMRDAIDAYVDQGGRVARFAGNFMWQIRLEQDGQTQVCHKYLAKKNDPFMVTGPRHLVTESWEAREIARPGALTFGLNATRCLYASWSSCSPRRGKGEVFHAGTCEWVAGLLRRDEMVIKVTRNVLDRFLG